MMKTSIIGAPLLLYRSQRIPASLKCYAATANSELLRSQLDRLHAEAESTRAKANSNRLRLLRLSEAAENLRKQAALCIHTGKENEARELLLQKKKVMQALDKAKARIELLDTLSSKLNEAISVKETKLIGNISLDLEVDRDDNTSSGIHIVSPKLESTEDRHENDQTSLDSQATFDTDNHVLDTLSSKLNEAISVKETKLIGNISLDLEVDRDDNTSGGIHIVSPKKLESTEDRHENDQTSLDSQDVEEYQDIDSLSGSRIFKESSSYESFLENLDEKLGRIEAELVTVVNVASLVLNHDKNLKVQQTAEILEEIRHVRQRIANIIYKEADIS